MYALDFVLSMQICEYEVFSVRTKNVNVFCTHAKQRTKADENV